MLFTVLLTGCVSLANNWLEHEGTYLVAHRGAHIIAPENTVESIHQAKILGYQAVEIDVRTSRDGVNFLMHDDTCLLYTSPSPRDGPLSRMPSSA